MMERILTVAALTDEIKELLEGNFDQVWVEGEISNLRRPASGHLYFTLKDDQAQIRAVWFKPFPGTRVNPARRRNSFDLEEGLSVVCRGRISVYSARGEYQIIIDAIEPKGTGALQKAFEQLKAKLSDEGLFDQQHKRPIPFLPERIGIITSPTGAVIRDILHITKRRFPAIPILVAPVRVQGAEAPLEIIRAIKDMTAYGKVDVLILARGGGSLEDLAPFNDEGVARAIFACSIPVISAIGHETDYTIADFTADLRAPTPSAAAELAVPQKEDLARSVADRRLRLYRSYTQLCDRLSRQLATLQERLRDPRRVIDERRLALDDYEDRMKTRLRQHLRNAAAHLMHIRTRLAQASPETQNRQRRFMVESYRKSMIAAMRHRIRDLHRTLDTNMSLLDSFSPLAVLSRGYSITFRSVTGEVIRDARTARTGEEITIRLARGRLLATVRAADDQMGDLPEE
jgi:exodeoxyribonuclease VII large subunit